jgi:hypothetical protein
MLYILVTRDTKFWLVGPFASEEDAADYGRTHYAPGGPNDPRWQTIELPHRYNAIGAACYSPDAALMIPDEKILDNFRV